MATSLGQVAVLFRSTMPSVGLSALEAMPVLKDLLGMSRMAVPVVSDPVPYDPFSIVHVPPNKLGVCSYRCGRNCERSLAYNNGTDSWGVLAISGLSLRVIGLPLPIGALINS
jgi:hypothetical protein